jgi:hypothetical protein
VNLEEVERISIKTERRNESYRRSNKRTRDQRMGHSPLLLNLLLDSLVTLPKLFGSPELSVTHTSIFVAIILGIWDREGRQDVSATAEVNTLGVKKGMIGSWKARVLEWAAKGITGTMGALGPVDKWLDFLIRGGRDVLERTNQQVLLVLLHGVEAFSKRARHAEDSVFLRWVFIDGEFEATGTVGSAPNSIAGVRRASRQLHQVLLSHGKSAMEYSLVVGVFNFSHIF